MSYVALYRKYRPLTFTDMIGQTHVTDVLKNQIRSDKISHAYIFSGTRGTGKTSAAKIFARAVNCLNPKEGDPCNECEACKSILQGDTTDVVEMDAASNNSVDNIRVIRQEVAYATTGLKYKIYIIDEAHMLSTSAFNALLKTLEEPPSNVIFILATTEEHKILPTILSRCIRFEFRKISKGDILQRLEYILKDSNVEYENEAIKYIAKLSDGGMRDALSILERCINDEDNKVTYSKLKSLIGNVEDEIIEELEERIIKYDKLRAIELTNKILDTGKDVRYIVGQLAERFMDVLTENKLAEKNISEIRLNQIIKELFKLDADIRQSVNSNLLFKAKILEISSNISFENQQDLDEKIKALELKIEKLEREDFNRNINVSRNEKTDKDITVKEVESSPVLNNVTVQPEIKISNPNQDTGMQKGKGEKILFKEIEKVKKVLVEKDNLQLYSALSGVEAYVESENIVFKTGNDFAFTIMNRDDNKIMLKEAVKEVSNLEYNVNIAKTEKSAKMESSFETHLLDNNIPFTVID